MLSIAFTSLAAGLINHRANNLESLVLQVYSQDERSRRCWARWTVVEYCWRIYVTGTYRCSHKLANRSHRRQPVIDLWSAGAGISECLS